MTVAAAAPTTSAAARFSRPWIAERLSRWPLHIAVIGLTVAWMVPTIGLLVSSFRPFSGQATSGWWTAFSNPTTFTLSNYTQVLSQGTTNLGQAFFNSFMIAVGFENAVHQPLVAWPEKGRNELTKSPMVGTIHATVRPITAMCNGHLDKRSAIHGREKRAAAEVVGAAAATVIFAPPPHGTAAN